MDSGVKLPWIRGRYTTGRGRNTVDRGVKIPWVEVKIPWVGGQNIMDTGVKIRLVDGSIYHTVCRDVKIPWVGGSICNRWEARYSMERGLKIP